MDRGFRSVNAFLFEVSMFFFFLSSFMHLAQPRESFRSFFPIVLHFACFRAHSYVYGESYRCIFVEGFCASSAIAIHRALVSGTNIIFTLSLVSRKRRMSQERDSVTPRQLLREAIILLCCPHARQLNSTLCRASSFLPFSIPLALSPAIRSLHADA